LLDEKEWEGYKSKWQWASLPKTEMSEDQQGQRQRILVGPRIREGRFLTLLSEVEGAA
jgi:hypothetical protein